MRDFLVFVRAGPRSVHPRWLEEDAARNWDCCVNYWGEPAGDVSRVQPEYREPGGVNKFEGFSEIYPRLFAERPYRRILMLDDDLEFKPGDLSRFFRHCEADQLDLAQPAIALGSHANHTINLHNPLCKVRRVNFVEVMAPCFSRPTLDLLLPSFLLTRCTWGIDYAWTSILAGKHRLGVVDAVTMRHLRPMDQSSGAFYQMLRRLGADPEQELASIYERFAPWGAMRTLRAGHRYRWSLRERTNEAMVGWMEARKLAVHLARGGTLATQTPPPVAAPIETPRGMSIA